MGRSTGSMKVRSRENTRAMKIPKGLVTAKISARKTKICNQPLIVMSEFLRAQESVEEVNGCDGADDDHDERLSIHGYAPTSPDRRNVHRRSIRQKKRLRQLPRLRLALLPPA